MGGGVYETAWFTSQSDLDPEILSNPAEHELNGLVQDRHKEGWRVVERDTRCLVIGKTVRLGI